MNNILSEQILPLSIAEKLKLIEDIWESVVVTSEQIPLTQAQKQKLERRLTSYDQVEKQGKSWEIVKQRIIKNDL